MASFSYIALLPAALLLAAAAVRVGATTFPATVEVDLIFPRNDTYAPTALFPIVFAFQNAPLAPSLDPGFSLALYSPTANFGPILDVTWANFSSNPTLVYTWVANVNTTSNGTAAAWSLLWSFGAANCSNVAGEQAVGAGGGFQTKKLDFTIKNGAQAADLVAATTNTDAAASCANVGSFAFNLTGIQDVAVPSTYDGHNSCAISDVLAPMAGNPCAVTVGSATASSISAALTASACAVLSPVVSCPPIKINAAFKGGRDLGYVGYATMLGGMMAAFVAIYCL